jgi:hypothetical protein
MLGMTQKPLSPTQQLIAFEYDEGHADQALNAWAGIPVVLQAFRSLDLPRSVQRHVSIKQRQRGLDEASYVESFLILNACGGEYLDDFEHLRKDGLKELIGHDLPSPEGARKFLYHFHNQQLIEQAQQRRLPGQTSYIPEENAALQGLGKVNQDLVRELAQLGAPQTIATIDLDSTIIESWKNKLSRLTRASAAAGGVGGDECGGGRSVSGWECAGAARSADRHVARFSSFAGKREGVLLSGGFGVL